VSRHRILTAELTREPCNPTAVCRITPSRPGADPPNHLPHPAPRMHYACETALNILSFSQSSAGPRNSPFQPQERTCDTKLYVVCFVKTYAGGWSVLSKPLARRH
jgi:hypothetical protein